ncbi:hypothetical protein BKA61DRAFT_575485 [Leptodontidium sp. MPI-SDFR-AT-0119]|nr:hypothetical protein BKA61DRAFT_575485 [Leptodontidium sp. MPI-SDFR-AT-0119]
MASFAQIGQILGFGGRAHVFEATIEGKPMALKTYHTKHFCKTELAIYEYLKESGLHPTYLPHYYGPIRLAPDHLRTIESSIHNAQGSTTYRVGIGIERIVGSCLGESINVKESFEEIQQTRPEETRAKEIYKLFGKFSRMPVSAGCQLIQDAVSCDTDTPKRFSDDLQIQLSHFLSSAQPAKSVSLLIDMILLTIKHPIGEPALALVRVLRSVGRFSEALRVLGSCVAAGSDAPLFDFQKAKVLQSLGLDSDSLPYFESAVLGFESRLGTDHITTQSCRCELAIQCIRSGDSKGAKLILAGLAKFF